MLAESADACAADGAALARLPALTWIRESERSARLLSDLRESVAELRELSATLREKRYDIGRSSVWVGTRLGTMREIEE